MAVTPRDRYHLPMPIADLPPIVRSHLAREVRHVQAGPYYSRALPRRRDERILSVFWDDAREPFELEPHYERPLVSGSGWISDRHDVLERDGYSDYVWNIVRPGPY
jgi:hypothetical protein